MTASANWTAPAGWAVNEVVTDSKMNAQVRDNLTYLKAVTDLARVNRLVNGGFEIWQRGTGAFTTNNAYTADRWQIVLGTSSTISVSKDTSNQDVASSACAALTYTHSAESFFQQKVEDYTQLRGQAISLSVRVKTSSANAVRLRLYDSTTNTYSAYHSGGGNYETLTVTATIGAAANQVLIVIDLLASCTVYVDNAMAVLGSVPANYVPLTPAEEWERCQRYFWSSMNGDDGATYTILFSGWSQTAGDAEPSGMVFFPTKMAVAPTITVVGTWSGANCNNPVVQSATRQSFRLYATSTANTAQASFYNGVSGRGITAEANP